MLVGMAPSRIRKEPAFFSTVVKRAEDSMMSRYLTSAKKGSFARHWKIDEEGSLLKLLLRT